MPTMPPNTPSHPSPLWRDPLFQEGVRDMVGVALGVAAWGLVTGVAMVKGGLSVPMALLMSFIVYAGSAQLVALPLMAAAAPMWVIWAAALCVNLRFVAFSAGWRKYFGHLPWWRRVSMTYLAPDMNYVVFTRRFPNAQAEHGQKAYFWGGVVTVWLAWQVPSVVGIALGDRIPVSWGLAFAGTLALVGIVCAVLVDRATWVAAAVAACAAVATYALPLKMNLLVAIAAAVAFGLLMDRFTPPPPGGAMREGAKA
jgi:predicted branched-subunit amino acid permease